MPGRRRCSVLRPYLFVNWCVWFFLRKKRHMRSGHPKVHDNKLHRRGKSSGQSLIVSKSCKDSPTGFFCRTSYMTFWLGRVHKDDRVKLHAVKSCRVFVNKSWRCFCTRNTAYNQFLLVLLTYHFALKSPRYCSGETHKETYSSHGYWKANIIKIWQETGSLLVLPTFAKWLNTDKFFWPFISNI
jgi:hypothetical protein